MLYLYEFINNQCKVKGHNTDNEKEIKYFQHFPKIKFYKFFFYFQIDLCLQITMKKTTFKSIDFPQRY